MMRYRQCLCHNFPSTLALWTALWRALWRAPRIHGLRRCTDLSLLPTVTLCQHGAESPTLVVYNASDVRFSQAGWRL
jgi:hypothetical protein